MILLRATAVNHSTLSLATKIQSLSGIEVSILIDERKNKIINSSKYRTISITDDKIKRFGIYAPSDYTWRCGDYGLYIASEELPNIDWFWLIEDDVDFRGNSPEFFFDFFKNRDEDFLTTYLRPAERSWFWYAHSISVDTPSYRCFFPVSRLSRRALQYLLVTRQRHSVYWSRIKTWPNDEAFVSTTLMGKNFFCADFNSFGTRFYSEACFNASLIDSTEALSECEFQLIHPLLTEGRAQRKKLHRGEWMQKSRLPIPSYVEALSVRVALSLNSRRSWYS
jgi:hypothetical protein